MTTTIADARMHLFRRALKISDALRREVGPCKLDGEDALKEAWLWLSEWGGTSLSAPVARALAEFKISKADLAELAEDLGWKR